MKNINTGRRRMLTMAAAGLTMNGLSSVGFAQTAGTSTQLALLTPIKQVNAGELNIGYFEAGPQDGPVVLLLHGYPYDVHSYIDVVPLLVADGCRVIVPHLRGHGTTRFTDAATARSGQQGAIGKDVIALLDALKIPKAVFAGYDWGGRAACVAAALWPERCNGLVSVNSYLIQDIAKAGMPLHAKVEAGFWYQFYFATERGRAGLTANRKDISRVLWERNSPTWKFDEATFERSAAAFNNPDYVEIVIHSYRHRLGLAEGYPHYEAIEAKLAEQPIIAVPTVTIDGDSDGVVPPTDGRSTATKFSANRIHLVIPGIGHNLPQEAPEEFKAAVMMLVHAKV